MSLSRGDQLGSNSKAEGLGTSSKDGLRPMTRRDIARLDDCTWISRLRIGAVRAGREGRRGCLRTGSKAPDETEDISGNFSACIL